MQRLVADMDESSELSMTVLDVIIDGSLAHTSGCLDPHPPNHVFRRELLRVPHLITAILAVTFHKGHWQDL